MFSSSQFVNIIYVAAITGGIKSDVGHLLIEGSFFHNVALLVHPVSSEPKT